MKLAAANADCKWCPDEIETACDVQSSLVKELCLWIRVNRKRSATPGTNTGLATQTDLSDQFRTRIAMTAAVQLVEEQTNGLQTDIFKLHALRCKIHQLQGCDIDASASLTCLRRVQNETFDARIRKCKVGRSSRPSARSR